LVPSADFFTSTFSPDNELILGRDQCVQADVEEVQACVLQLGQQPGKVDAIGRHADGPQALQLPHLG